MNQVGLAQSIVDILPAVRQTLGRPRNLIVIDARRDLPAVFVAYFRAWLRDGMRLLALADRDWRDADSWLGNDAKLLLVLQQGRALTEPIRDLINRLGTKLYHVIGFNSETQAVVQTINPLPEHVDHRHAEAALVSLELSGAVSQTVSRAGLPMKVKISSRHADAFSAQFGIIGRGPDLPTGQQTWFRLDPGFEGTLSIDRDVDLDGDAWRLEIGGGSRPVKRLIRTEPLPNAEARPLDVIAVVLDRTCPDNVNWERAFNLVHAKADVVEPWRSDQGPQPEHYNAEIRNGLTEGLKQAFASNLVREVQSSWFKDVPGNGIANFVVAMHLDGEEAGRARLARNAEQCGDLFSVAGYSPGLDLWDPVERALELARQALDGSGAEHRAILLVGNSPPTHPTQGDSPLASLARPPGAGMACTTRRQDPGWHDALASCAKSRIPVFYLFLRHTMFGGVSHAVMETFEHSQGRVETALAQTVGLEAVVADAGSVSSAVVKAIGSLRVQSGLASNVTLEIPRAGTDETW